jgi:hypothetical protein
MVLVILLTSCGVPMPCTSTCNSPSFYLLAIGVFNKSEGNSAKMSGPDDPVGTPKGQQWAVTKR